MIGEMRREREQKKNTSERKTSFINFDNQETVMACGNTTQTTKHGYL